MNPTGIVEIAIAVFLYKRPWHTQQTLRALRHCFGIDEYRVYLFCDGPKSEIDKPEVAAVREVAALDSAEHGGSVYRSESNRGLAASVIDGVSSVLRKHDAVVVVEDDIVLARNALQYFHQALHYYRHSGGVGSVSGYAHPPSLLSIPRHYPYDAYFLGRSFSWGWATWSDRWEQVNWDVSRWERLRQDERVVRGLSALGPDVPLMLDMQLNGKIDSWAIRYTLHHFLNGLLSLTPVHSYVQNIGLDGSGTHTGNTRRYENDLSLAMSNPLLPPFVAPNPLIAERFRRLYVQSRKARFKQLKRRAKRGAKQLIGRLRARDS